MNKNDHIYNKVKRQFNKGCVDYHLLSDDDHILVALSGGKDSLMLVRLLAERARIFKPRISIEAAHVIMDNIPYESDKTYLQEYCNGLGVKLHILHSRFDESTDKRKTKCFLCAWNRRKALFEFAEANGFNKIALGHHMDDFLTTLLMNMTFDGAFAAMSPILPLQHYPLAIIRPMCLVEERLIITLAEALGLQKQKVKCPYEQATNRSTMNALLHQLEEINPEARYNLWRAMSNAKADQLPVKPHL